MQINGIPLFLTLDLYLHKSTFTFIMSIKISKIELSIRNKLFCYCNFNLTFRLHFISLLVLWYGMSLLETVSCKTSILFFFYNNRKKKKICYHVIRSFFAFACVEHIDIDVWCVHVHRSPAGIIIFWKLLNEL